MTCAELRSACESAQSDQSLLDALWKAKDQRLIKQDKKENNQTAVIRILICVFIGRTFNTVHFLTISS